MNILFKALNDESRRQILELLRHKELPAGEIAAHFAMSKAGISHHLDLLKQAGLIEPERRGQFIFYTLNTTVVDEVLAWVLKLTGKKDKSPSTLLPSAHAKKS